MNKNELRVGDIIDLKGKEYVIAHINYAWHDPAGNWQIEFVDATGHVRNWKQWCDGGKLLDCRIDYKTKDDILAEINLLIKRQEFVERNDSRNNVRLAALEARLQRWNDLLDCLVAISEHVKDKTPVVAQCETCSIWQPIMLEDIIGLVAHDLDYECRACISQANYDADPANHDDSAMYYGDDAFEPAPEDIEDASQNMPCDNCGFCVGDSCWKYYECNGFK